MSPHPCHSKFSLYSLLLLLVAAFALAGCTIKLVDDYDAKTYEEILRVGKDIDKFYGDLLEQPDNARDYEKFAQKYVQLETELRSLYIRNKSRPLNEESTKISESILNLWIKYKDRHKERKTYTNGNARLDRNRFTRLFISAASAEEAKKLTPDDTDAAKESQ